MDKKICIEKKIKKDEKNLDSSGFVVCSVMEKNIFLKILETPALARKSASKKDEKKFGFIGFCCSLCNGKDGKEYIP